MAVRNHFEINGKCISYLKAGNGQDVILFLHGNSMTADNWLPQLENKELKTSYTLVAIDLPGHGKSEWSAENAERYHPKNIAHLMKPLLDHLKAKRHLLVGISLGTNIIGEMSSSLEGCKGIMLVSPCIVNDQNLPGNFITAGPFGYVIATPNPPDEDIRSFVYSHLKDPKLAEKYIIDYKNTDPAFRGQLGKMMVDSSWADEIGNIQGWNMPICVVFGVDDSLLKIAYLDNFSPLWNNKVHLIDQAGHFLNEEQPE